jgi:hypothetical protein
MLEFTTTPKTDPAADDAAAGGTPPFRCLLDGVELVAVKPKDALIAEIAPVSSRRTPPLQKLKLALNFLDDCLQEPGRSYVAGRLLDRDDDLDVDDVMPILDAIGEHWKANAPKRRR